MRKEQPTTMSRHLEEGAANPQDAVPAYQPDDGTMSQLDLQWLRGRVAGELPTGLVIRSATLFQHAPKHLP